MLCAVARVRSRRSCFGPGWVRSWGSTALAVVGELDPGEEPAAGPALAVGGGVVLGQRPDRGLAGRRPARPSPSTLRSASPRARRGRLGFAGPVWPYGSAGRARRRCRESAEQPRPLLAVDHVVGRGGDIAERPDHLEVVVESVERLDLGHGRHPSASARPPGRVYTGARRGVAQPGSALPLGGRGPRFESARPDSLQDPSNFAMPRR